MTPLLAPDGPGLMLDGVELYVTEAHHDSGSAGEGPSHSFRGLHLLISFAADEAERRRLWPVQTALAFGRTTHWTGADWPQRLATLTAASRPDFALAVVYAGAGERVVAQTVQGSIAELQRQLGPALAAVVVVAEVGAWTAELQGVTGFVRGASPTSSETARQVYLALSVFLAPVA
jgi:hypothetical protein